MLLVVGYTEYGRYQCNSCEEALEALAGGVAGDEARLIAAPVSLRFVRYELPAAIEALRPTALLGLGMAPGASSVVAELAAANLAAFSSPDVDGYRADHEELFPGEPLVVEIPAPRERILGECVRRRGLRLRLGLSTGTYLCNALAYTLAIHAARLGAPAAFLHLPLTPRCAARSGEEPGASTLEVVEAVRCVAEQLVAEARARGRGGAARRPQRRR